MWILFGILVLSLEFKGLQSFNVPVIISEPLAPPPPPENILYVGPRSPIIHQRYTLDVGQCRVALFRPCPDTEINFFLYTKENPKQPQLIEVGKNLKSSNLSNSSFNQLAPTKIIIHGYNSDMFLNVLEYIREEYLKSGDEYNVFAVDWSPLSQGPCYPAAVWNARHAGKCAAQLVERLREAGAEDIHVIGFSLGAHVPNFMAINLRPYKIPRITGLDPALPLFITTNIDEKLDKTDGEFVDIIHTNALLEGKVEQCGHVDFYLNGGTIQPGCWAEHRFLSCNHHRAPQYFAESINTKVGFWGWPCSSYLAFLFGNCPPKEPEIIMGEHINYNSTGVYLVITNAVSPFAVGKFTGPAIDIYYKSEFKRKEILQLYRDEVTNYMMTIDEDSIASLLYPENIFVNNNDDLISLLINNNSSVIEFYD